MKKLIFFLSILFCFNALAEQKSLLVKYYDCASSTNYISDHLPIFIKIDDKKISSPYSAGAYTKGLNIGITTDSHTEISKVHMGDKLTIEVADLEKGLQFGIGPLTAHTIQLVDFRPEAGGILQFGFLKKFSAKKNAHPRTEKGNLNEFFLDLYGDSWGTHNVYLTRNKQTNKWEIQNIAQNKVKAIFGILDIKHDLFVFGIPEMLDVTVNKGEVIYTQNKKSSTLKKGNTVYKCQN